MANMGANNDAAPQQHIYPRPSTFSPASSSSTIIQNRRLPDPFVAAAADYPPQDNNNMAASDWAKLVCSGTLDPNISDRYRDPTRHNMNANSSSQIVLQQQPVIKHWGSYLIDALPIPPFLPEALRNKPPSLEDAVEHMPFYEPSDHLKPSTNSVILIRNIPFQTSKQEILAAVSRNASLASQPHGTSYYAIHIIMERNTGKTMDCYVELDSEGAAREVLNAFWSRYERKRAPRIGDRMISIEHSSQEALMTALFPKARGVEWRGQKPMVNEPTEAYDSGFQGFITAEEMTMVHKHASTPMRSPFAVRCLNRTYESMISTLHKYPWWELGLVTMQERALLFETTVKLVKILMNALRNNTEKYPDGTLPQLTVELLQELVCAALHVPFGGRQKSTLIHVLHSSGYGAIVESITGNSLHPVNMSWPFFVLEMKPGAQMEVLEYYVSLLRRGSTPPLEHIPEQQRLLASQESVVNNPFGLFRVNYHTADIGSLTTYEAAALEWDAIEAMFRQVLQTQDQIELSKHSHKYNPDLLGDDEFYAIDSPANNLYTTPPTLPAPATSSFTATSRGSPRARTRTDQDASSGASADKATPSKSNGGKVTTGIDVADTFTFFGLGAGVTSKNTPPQRPHGSSSSSISPAKELALKHAAMLENSKGKASAESPVQPQAHSPGVWSTGHSFTNVHPSSSAFPQLSPVRPSQTSGAGLNPSAPTFDAAPGAWPRGQKSWAQAAKEGVKKAFQPKGNGQQ